MWIYTPGNSKSISNLNATKVQINIILIPWYFDKIWIKLVADNCIQYIFKTSFCWTIF